MENHHPEGRWGPGKPYISNWTIPLTKDQHDRIHVALRAQHLQFPSFDRPQGGPGLWYYLQERLRLHVELLADQ